MLRRRIALACAAAVAAVSTFPWGAQAQGYPPAVSELVARAKAEVERVDIAGFKSALDRNDAGLVVDVREPAEFAEGHVPGAINIPRGLVEFRIWPHVGYPAKTDLGRRITLYCGSGARCALAAKSLKDLGLSGVVAVDMSIEAWRAAGYPLTRD